MNSVNSMRVLAIRSAALARPATRKISDEIKKRPIYPSFLKIQEKYSLYQRNMDTPIHLRGGFWDHALYNFTKFGTIVTVLWTISFYAVLINK